MAGRAGSGNGYMDEDWGDGPLYLSKEQIEERRSINRELSSIDEILVRYAGVKTPTEISEMTGVAPEEVARRIHQILNAVDILTIEQKRGKMVLMLEAMIAEAHDRMYSATGREFPALANATGGNVTRVLNELADMESRTKLDIETINRRRAHELVHIVERSFDRSLGELKARYPEVDENEIQGIFRGYLIDVAREYDEDL